MLLVPRGLRPVGGEHVQAAANLDASRPSTSIDLELGARLVGFHDPWRHQRRDVGRADHRAAVVEDLHQVAMADAALRRRPPG